MLSRGFVSAAVSLLRASESRVFTASMKRSLYTMNGRAVTLRAESSSIFLNKWHGAVRPVSFVLCRHMSNDEKRFTAGERKC